MPERRSHRRMRLVLMIALTALFVGCEQRVTRVTDSAGAGFDYTKQPPQATAAELRADLTPVEAAGSDLRAEVHALASEGGAIPPEAWQHLIEKVEKLDAHLADIDERLKRIEK